MRFLPTLNYGVLFSFSKKRNKQTVEGLAKVARRKLIGELGEAGFARAFMQFDRQIEIEAALGDMVQTAHAGLSTQNQSVEPNRAAAKTLVVARLFNSAEDVQELQQQLALVWLTGHGWGHLGLNHLLGQP